LIKKAPNKSLTKIKKMEKQKTKSKLDKGRSTSATIKEAKHTPTNNTASVVRFSDEELKEFKELILLKLDKSTMDYELLKENLSLKGDNGTNDTSPTFKLLEDGAEASSKEETANYTIRLQKYIKHLQNALTRIENKTYGICIITGKLISKERLRSVPHSTMCIDAKRATIDK